MRQSGLGLNNGWDVLLVLPNAIPSDAVLQALDLTRALSLDYRVHVLLMDPAGTLANAFRAVSVGIWYPGDLDDPLEFATFSIDTLSSETSLAFAICTSTHCRDILRYLKQRKIPTIALISELASRTKPITAVGEVIALADHVVVPSRLVLDDAIATDYLLNSGRNQNIASPLTTSLSLFSGFCKKSIKHSRPHYRLDTGKSKRFVVLGAGPISYESGVDLFLEVSRLVSAKCQDFDILFVWADTANAETSEQYDAEIKAQIQAFGLSSKFLIQSVRDFDLHSTLEEIDVFFLSARLSTISYIGIEALKSGIPVVSFDKATVFSERLKGTCYEYLYIADYLSPSSAASRIAAIISNTFNAPLLKLTNRHLAKRIFDSHEVIDLVSGLIEDRRPNFKTDHEEITKSKRFDMEFFLQNEVSERSIFVVVSDYLERIWTGYNIKKPEPGFHPLKFSQSGLNQAKNDPYAEFVRLGRPKGPWYSPVIYGGPEACSYGVDQRIISSALHIHAYYIDQVKNILARLNFNTVRPDLFISVKSEIDRKAVEDIGSRIYCGNYVVEVVPNLGRDIGPLLTQFGKRLVDGYEIIGHVHTKKSLHASDSGMVDRWVNFLFSGVIGGLETGAIVDRIFSFFSSNPKLGIVFPDDPHVFGWTSNRQHADLIAQSMELGALPDAINFPAGSMFWIRSELLQNFVQLDLDWGDYPPEPLPADGTVLHALERLFGVAPELKGWETAVTFGKYNKR